MTWASGLLNRTRLDFESCQELRDLLQRQDYIDRVEIVDGPVGGRCINLNEFRKHVRFNNLAYSHLAIAQPDEAPYVELTTEPWIRAEPATMPGGKDTVILRNLRYQSNHFFWESLPRETSSRAVFIGSV